LQAGMENGEKNQYTAKVQAGFIGICEPVGREK
jgi:hypothetical protein